MSNEVSKTDCCKDATLDEEYSSYRDKFINMLTEFEHMWNVPLAFLQKKPPRFEVEKTDSQPVHSASYNVGPKAWESEKKEINRMLDIDVIEPGYAV